MNKSKTIKNKGKNKYSKKYRKKFKNGKSKLNKCKTMKSITYELQKIQKLTEEVRRNNLKLTNNNQIKNDKQNKQNKN